MEDDEDVPKEQDQTANEEQQIQNETEVPDLEEEQPVNDNQQGVPNLAVPTNEQNDQAEAEQNVNQVSDPVSTIVPIREFVPEPWKHQKSHPLDLIISDLNKGIQNRSQMRNFCAHFAFLSTLEPNNHEEALKDSKWVFAM